MATNAKAQRIRAASSTSTATPGAAPENPLLRNDKLKQLYLTMLKCRMLTENKRLARWQTRMEAPPCTLGKEAALAGVAMELLPEDTIGPSQFDFITGFIKSASHAASERTLLNQMLSTMGGARANVPGKRRLDNTAKRGATTASTIAAQLEIATGLALAHTLAKSKGIAVAFAGIDACPADLWQEALRFAGARKLPILYVCLHNTHSTLGGARSTGLRLKSRQQDIASVAESCGIPSIAVDGNDVVAVYRVAQEAMQRARNGDGPALIECVEPSWSQSGSPYPSANRKFKDANDPIRMMEQYLAAKGLFSASWKQQHSQKFSATLDATMKRAGL